MVGQLITDPPDLEYYLTVNTQFLISYVVLSDPLFN
jgi:hypothetical protein